MIRGLIHLYYGFGKGKTTAAFGLALRAAAYNKKVVIVQFMKNRPSGEILSMEKLDGITVLRGTGCDSFINSMSSSELSETAAIQEMNFEKALSLISEKKCDMLILDEGVDAYSFNLIDREKFKSLICDKPEELELVLTGHSAEGWIVQRADYVSEMLKIKHPYDQKVCARAGIEF